jgi:hypothetical protein
MSVISDHDLERLASLLMGGNEADLTRKIVRLLQMDDDACDAPHEAHSTDRQCKPWNGHTLN